MISEAIQKMDPLNNKYFFIKTLQFYDYQGNPLKFPGSNPVTQSKAATDSFIEEVDIYKNTEPLEGQQTPKKFFSLHNPILIEQVTDIPYEDTFYDVSFVHHGSKIFYFKRHFNEKVVKKEGANAYSRL
jgi:hypothetical protein